MSADLITGLSARSWSSFGLSANTQTMEPSSASRILSEASKYTKTFARVGYSTWRGSALISARLEGKLAAAWMQLSIINCVSSVGL
jgi:hypothetical protein